jgi:hypothetical protein
MGEEHLVQEPQQHRQGQVHQGGGLLAHQQAYPPEINTRQHISNGKLTMNKPNRENRSLKKTRKATTSKCPDKVIEMVLNFPFLNDQLIIYG